MPMRLRASAVIVHNGSLLLVHRIKDGNEYYVFPGGGIEAGETPEEAVVRELREEAGITAAVVKRLGELPLPDIGQHMHLLQCSVGEAGQSAVWQEGHKQTDANFYELAWVPVQELGSLPLRPKQAAPFVTHIDRTKS